MISRPSLDEILAYRDHVDGAVAKAIPGLGEDGLGLVELGLNHEQQHQELMLTDILATFTENPLMPAMWDHPPATSASLPDAIRWEEGRHGGERTGQDRKSHRLNSSP